LLDEYLKKFYDDEYFRPDDEYAVAVPVNGGSELLELINAANTPEIFWLEHKTEPKVSHRELLSKLSYLGVVPAAGRQRRSGASTCGDFSIAQR
jgi:hypothetical protein